MSAFLFFFFRRHTPTQQVSAASHGERHAHILCRYASWLGLRRTVLPLTLALLLFFSLGLWKFLGVPPTACRGTSGKATMARMGVLPAHSWEPTQPALICLAAHARFLYPDNHGALSFNREKEVRFKCQSWNVWITGGKPCERKGQRWAEGYLNNKCNPNMPLAARFSVPKRVGSRFFVSRRDFLSKINSNQSERRWPLVTWPNVMRAPAPFYTRLAKEPSNVAPAPTTMPKRVAISPKNLDALKCWEQQHFHMTFDLFLVPFVSRFDLWTDFTFYWQFLNINTHTHTHVSIYVYMYTHIHICTHLYMYTHTHICVYVIIIIIIFFIYL